ncbi:MAG: hypothetical protein KDE19_18940 [Caldilineaceae bacterium]|nr:hypothetical protein [Caldilineaceae bacterium]
MDSLSADEERLEEQLADPLYQLLVCHTIFCRQIEEKFTRLPRNPNPQHRTMRRPHQRTPQHP